MEESYNIHALLPKLERFLAMNITFLTVVFCLQNSMKLIEEKRL
jgi:hypothetical protein